MAVPAALTFLKIVATTCGVKEEPTALSPATLRKMLSSLIPACESQPLRNRRVIGDKYTAAPSPVASVFNLLIRILPLPSPASAISSTLRDTNSSLLHIVS